MAFAPPFGRVFFPSFDRRNAGGAWWNAFGAIPAANCIAAYQPKGAADLAASKINLANPGTYNAAAGSDPSFATATGWTFNGSSQYLVTGVKPTPTGTWSGFIQYTGLSGATKTLWGMYESSATGAFLVQSSSTNMRSYNGAIADNATIMSSGNYGIAGKTPYRNGSAEANTIGSGSTTVTIDIYIGALNYNGGPIQYAGIVCIALSIYNIALTSAQVTNLYNAMNAL